RECNETKRELPGGSIQSLFEEAARKWSSEPAVREGEGELSYGELNARANRLARYLKERGAGAGVKIGLCMERSAEMIVAMLAILKTGGAYVPLDGEYPA